MKKQNKNNYSISFTYRISIIDKITGLTNYKYENMTITRIKATNKNNAIVELVKNLDLDTIKFFLSNDENLKHYVYVNEIINFEIMNILKIEKSTIYCVD